MLLWRSPGVGLPREDSRESVLTNMYQDYVTSLLRKTLTLKALEYLYINQEMSYLALSSSFEHVMGLQEI